jgi:hypothetical protein
VRLASCQQFVVHGEALHQVLVQAPDRPLAELRAPVAANTETDGEYGVQIVVFYLSGYLPATLQSNYSEFPNSCHCRQLSLVIDAFQMFINRRHRYLKQLRDKCLRQPDRFIFKTALNTRPPVLGLVEDDFGLGQGFVTHGRTSLCVMRAVVC